MTVGYLASGFDLLNVRDLDLVAQAAERCERLVVGVLSDELMLRLHGRRPVVPLTERVALVGHVRGVHKVVEHTDVALPTELRAQVADDLVCFVAADEPSVIADADVVALVPRRESASEVLRATLRPAAERVEAVA